MKNLKLVSSIIERLKMQSLGIIFCLAIVSFSVFVVLSQVQASPAEELQPASTITYNQELVVNATGRFDSVYIGKQGTGGVTFFNGTIVNSTTGTAGADNPVTFGDNVRFDGILFRTEEGGNNPLKIGDTLKPQTTAAYDLGTTTNQFRHAYFSGTVTVGRLAGAGVVDSSNILDTTVGTSDLSDSAVTTAKIYDATIATADIADDAITTAKIADSTITGDDIASTADLSVNSINWTGRTGTISIPHSSCQDGNNSHDYIVSAVSTYYAGGSANFYCPARLPHGSRITGVDFYAYDGDANDITFNLIRNNYADNTYEEVTADVSTSGTPFATSVSATTINYPTVDNSAYNYSVSVEFPAAGGSAGLNFRGATITYSYSEPY